MRIERHCHERLPGGERLWRKLALRAEFEGTLLVYGYGVHGRPGAEQRRSLKGEMAQVGDHLENEIRVWMPSPCQTVTTKFSPGPLGVFAHELGHFRHFKTRRKPIDAERAADRYAARILKDLT